MELVPRINLSMQQQQEHAEWCAVMLSLQHTTQKVLLSRQHTTQKVLLSWQHTTQKVCSAGNTLHRKCCSAGNTLHRKCCSAGNTLHRKCCSAGNTLHRKCCSVVVHVCAMRVSAYINTPPLSVAQRPTTVHAEGGLGQIDDRKRSNNVWNLNEQRICFVSQ